MKSERRQRTAMVSVRFAPDELAEVEKAAEAAGMTVSGLVRDVAIKRRPEPPAASPALRVAGSASMALSIGPGDSWRTVVQTGPWASRYCCEEGHGSPEDAAAHGALLATQALSAWARNLEPPAIGALILRGESTAA